MKKQLTFAIITIMFLCAAISSKAASSITYSPSTVSFTQGWAITSMTPTVNGFIANGYSITPALPAGLNFDTSTGVISGTPTATSAAATYTIFELYYGVAFAFTTVNITVSAANVYDWMGQNSTSWTTAKNWKKNNTTQSGTGSYPGQSSTDIVRIGVVGYTGVYQPSITASVSFGSIEFGTNNTPVLTIASGQTLTLGKGLTVDASSTATLSMDATAILDLSGGSISNSGTITVSSGQVKLEANGPYITNSGTFTLNEGGLIYALNDNSASAGAAIINTAGTFTIGTTGSTGSVKMGNYSGIDNKSGAAFIVGPASVLYFSTTSTQNVSIFNETGGTFTLQSDNTGSAAIGAIPQNLSNTVSGTINVQRYITGGTGYRGYRLFSSPVYAAAVNSNNVYSLNYLSNTLPLSGAADGGFGHTGNPCIFLFDESVSPKYTTFLNSNWQAINNLSPATAYNYGTTDASHTTAYIPVGNGFLCFFRGDKTNTVNPYTSTAVPAAATLSTSGTVNQGTISVKLWYNSGSANLGYTTSNATATGFNLVGNPYPSSIDWDTYNKGGVTGTNLSTKVWMLNPNGSYDYYDSATKTGSGNATHIISSGVGFFVQATGGSAALTFTEAAKTNAQATGKAAFMGKPVENNNVQHFHLQMKLDSFYNQEAVFVFNNGAKSTYNINEDAVYKAGSCKVSLNSISDDNVALVMNQLSLPGKTQKAIALNVAAAADGIYQLNLKNMAGIPKFYDIWLMDAYKKDSVDMRVNPSYSFNIYKNDTSSYGSKRFSLVIRQNPGYAYRLLDFTAAKILSGSQVEVAWKAENEQNYTNFTVERSTDGGKTFQVIGGVQSSGANIYGLPDKSPVNGLNLYRLASQDINNEITYSPIVKVQYSNQSNTMVKSNINVYPNPASNMVNLTIDSKMATAGNYNIRITNSTGLVIAQSTTTQSQWQTNVSGLMPGTYFIHVINTKDNTIVGQSRFVKI